jgi:hypothetical protein
MISVELGCRFPRFLYICSTKPLLEVEFLVKREVKRRKLRREKPKSVEWGKEIPTHKRAQK